MVSRITAILRRLSNAIDIINNIDSMVDYAQRSNQLLVSALTSTRSICQSYDNGAKELIVSLTSYSKRIHDIHLVIESIAHQTVRPNRLILWLDENEFASGSLPIVLHRQIERGLEVRYCPNYRSYKKLIPALGLFPNANIITIDDDMLYPHDMVEQLMAEEKLFPGCVISHVARKMQFAANGALMPYKNWDYLTTDDGPSKLTFPVGFGGILYPPNVLNSECSNDNVFMKVAPYADDVWFKAMSLLEDVECKKVSDSRLFGKRFLPIPGSQDTGLFRLNLTKGANDDPITMVFEKYDLYRKLLSI